MHSDDWGQLWQAANDEHRCPTTISRFKVYSLSFYNTGLHHEMRVIVPLCSTRKTKTTFSWWGTEDKFSCRSLSCSVSLARRQQSGLLLVWVLYCLLMLSRWVPMKFSGGFDHLLQSPSVLSCAHPMPICNVSSQDSFYCSSVKVDKNLAQSP